MTLAQALALALCPGAWFRCPLAGIDVIRPDEGQGQGQSQGQGQDRQR